VACFRFFDSKLQLSARKMANNCTKSRFYAIVDVFFCATIAQAKNESSLNFLQKVSFSSPDFEFAAIRPHKVDLPLYTAVITCTAG
jgi:hypothetical protein